MADESQVTDSAENRLDTSIDKTIQSVSNSGKIGKLLKTGDKIVERTIMKIPSYFYIYGLKINVKFPNRKPKINYED